MSKHLVITFMGKDQPGVVESLSTTISNLGANWLESRMCHLGGQFAGVLRVAVEEKQEADLIKSLLELQESGLTITMKSGSGEMETTRRSLVTLDLLGSDQVGIVSRISAMLAGLGIQR
jgi:glycine cleavage system regulatory protein